MAALFETLQDLLFPPHCLGCEKRLPDSRPPLYCSSCAADLRFLRSPLCTCCGLPFPCGTDHLCGDCLAAGYAFDLARSLLQYRPPLSDLILSLKFTGNLAGLATLRSLIAQSQVLNTFSEPDLVLPVPLHAARLRERGFNQALVIARGCLPQWKNRIDPGTLVRVSPTPPQSLLSGKERRNNLRGVFSLAKPAKVAGAVILLIDDVYTTGSTVNECSRILRAAGAERIEVFTLARSLAPGLLR